MPELQLEELTWKEIRDEVYTVNPRLTQIIDQLSPNDSLTLFKASYPYGSKILHNGKFFLPCKDGTLIHIEDNRIDNHIKSRIGYNLFTNPATLTLKNTLDLFITLENRIVNYSLIYPGNIFGLWRILDYPKLHGISYAPISIWDMTAGARSLFILPKMTDANGFHNLEKELKVRAERPKLLKDQWPIFCDIVKHPSFKNTWTTDLLFFSDKWFESLQDDAWRDFRIFLFESTWKGSEFWRNQFTWDLTFSRIQEDRGIKPWPYVADLVSHLLSITVGAVPGFRPAIDDSLAPISGLQKVFEEVYKLNYAPIFIEPAYFSVFEPDQRPIYYSLNYQTAIRLSQKSSKRSAMVTDLYNIRSLLGKYIKDIKSDSLNIAATPLYEMTKIVRYDFFHHDLGEYTEIKPSSQILKADKSFAAAAKGAKVKSMPKNPPFLQGCIRVSSDGK